MLGESRAGASIVKGSMTLLRVRGNRFPEQSMQVSRFPIVVCDTHNAIERLVLRQKNMFVSSPRRARYIIEHESGRSSEVNTEDSASSMG